LENDNLDGFKKQLIESVNSQRNIDIYLDSEIDSVSGHIGDFKLNSPKKANPERYFVGPLLLATGQKPAVTKNMPTE
jgi:hypothetical protein